ncbi:MAG TPA: DUF3426 domain-containing protein [Caulobacteraceae bacterium]|nr:DUF3426 domain-containing protein [Caulobacteraceae bacterium]
MILTCPECATGYFVDDAQIGPEGRNVKCAACGARWRATPEAPASLDIPSMGATEDPVALDQPEVEPERLSGDDLPRAFRTRAEEERRLRRAAISGAIWAGAGLAAVVLIGLAILFRESVVRAWPQTASAYRAIGFPVNPVGLVIEDVRAEPALLQGHAVLEVSGVIRNVVDRVVAAPPLRVSLLNPQGKRVAGQIDALANARIPPGETRHFVTAIFDPPLSAYVLKIEFAVGARADAVAMRGAGPVAAPPLTLRGPAQADPAFSNDAPPASAAATPPLPPAPAANTASAR